MTDSSVTNIHTLFPWIRYDPLHTRWLDTAQLHDVQSIKLPFRYWYKLEIERNSFYQDLDDVIEYLNSQGYNLLTAPQANVIWLEAPLMVSPIITKLTINIGLKFVAQFNFSEWLRQNNMHTEYPHLYRI